MMTIKKEFFDNVNDDEIKNDDYCCFQIPIKMKDYKYIIQKYGSVINFIRDKIKNEINDPNENQMPIGVFLRCYSDKRKNKKWKERDKSNKIDKRMINLVDKN